MRCSWKASLPSGSMVRGCGRIWPRGVRISGKSPERARKAAGVEQRLVVLAGVGLPVGVQAVAVPRLGELPERGQVGDVVVAAAGYVLARAERANVRAGRNHVLPPLRRWAREADDVVLGRGLGVRGGVPQLTTAGRADGDDLELFAQHGDDPEAVPRAAAPP